MKSLKLMEETMTERSESADLDGASSSKVTPVSVLDGIWTESESDNGGGVTVSDERGVKRRKVGSCCDGDGEFRTPFQEQ